MIKAINVSKSFGEPPLEILHHLDFEIPTGSFTSITGRSGSGKSTLLYILSSLDQPSEGKVILGDRDISQLSEKDLHQFRNLEMGFIFQFHFLLPELTTLENVLMPARRTEKHIALEPRAKELLRVVGLGEKLHRLPKQLSGGEQQRVAIARALIMSPKFIFADEPTGNLDSVNGEIVMKQLKDFSREEKTTVVYVTHDPDFAMLADYKIQLSDGHLVK